MRAEIRAEIESIAPFDDAERATRDAVLAWVDSGAELCRMQKPATPDKHLVSYVLLIDGDHLLLVDHRNAGLWLPAGGHVEPGEHPRETARREVVEELGIEIDVQDETPVFLTSATTVGKTAGHVDVALWYLASADRRQAIAFDVGEFRGYRWFHRDQVPFERADPAMARFVAKHYGAG